jgi:hypothetical protein
MFGQEIEEALAALDEFEKTLEKIHPKSDMEELALEKARAQAARLTTQLRKLQDGEARNSAECED